MAFTNGEAVFATGGDTTESKSASAARTALGLGTLATVTPTGTPDGTKFLRDDGSWQASGGGGLESDGNENLVAGIDAGSAFTDGFGNTFLGSYAGDADTGGDENTGVGYSAGTNIEGGNYNTCAGAYSGQGIVDGEYNVCIGYAAGQSATDPSNQLFIDSLETGDGALLHGDFDNRTLDINGVLAVKPSGGNKSVEFDENATSGETRMLLWDVTGGTLQRVSIGANDSGGSGYRVLRIPNSA